MQSPDAPSQYIATMNAIFAAQRDRIRIDSCYLGPQQSAFLQQAAHLTGATYLRPARPAGLLQYLLMVRESLTGDPALGNIGSFSGCDGLALSNSESRV